VPLVEDDPLVPLERALQPVRRPGRGRELERRRRHGQGGAVKAGHRRGERPKPGRHGDRALDVQVGGARLDAGGVDAVLEPAVRVETLARGVGVAEASEGGHVAAVVLDIVLGCCAMA